jgi:flagellar P-ring protein precursor FlgI
MRYLNVTPIAVVLLLAPLAGFAASAAEPMQVRLKELGRLDGWRDNALVGYGLVTGLAGTGDSFRNRTTSQSISNLLSRFGLSLTSEQVQSRNVAAVMVTASLPPFARAGGRVDVTVTSLGDARSLVGGVLLLSPLRGPDARVHALAQGPISVGGYKYDLFGNVVQKNHPTSGAIPGGAVIEAGVDTKVVSQAGTVTFVLNDPDYTTASRVSEAINIAFGQPIARPRDAGSIEVSVPAAESDGEPVTFLRRVENVSIAPDQRAKVVVNERNGTVVSGGDVRISKVTIAYGDLKVSITTDYGVSQPYPGVSGGYGPRYGGYAPGYGGYASGGRTAVVPHTRVEVDEVEAQSVSLEGQTTVADLVRALNRIKTSPRDMISILQSMKTAGALHAELIIQ